MNESDYAIAVGISLYPDEFTSLKAPVRDATRFMEWVHSSDGGDVPEENTRLITTQLNQSSDALLDAKPDQDDIDQALIDFGNRLKWKKAWHGKFMGRRLYFYFAGHGYASDSQTVGMLMADAGPTRLRKSASLRDYRTFFADRALFAELVFVVDCCRDPLPLGAIMEEPSPPSFTLNRSTHPPAINEFVLLAAEYGWKAYESKDPETQEQSGVLTRIVLRALRTARDDRGRVTAASIKEYLLDHPEELRTRINNRTVNQSPLCQGNAVESARPADLIFAHVAAAPECAPVSVRIVAPASFTGDLIVLADGKDEVSRRPATEATRDAPPWIVPLLPSRRYVVRNVISPTKSRAAVIGWPELEVTGHVFVFPGDDADN